MRRNVKYTQVDGASYDVTIVGGGVSGSRLYSELCQKGYRVLLVDRGDFGCGTSQASGMMIWGGLLYLKNLDFKTVYKLCQARDRFIADFPKMIDSCSFRYMPSAKGGRNRLFVQWALYLYWLIGSYKRQLPRGEKLFSELSLIKENNFKDSLVYEEAFLNLSDCRFVLQWLMPWESDRTQALNYCSVESQVFKDGQWNLSLRDLLGENKVTCKSKFIVNAAGVWTDEVNSQFGIESDYKHIFSKGVYMNLPRPELHKTALIFEMGQHGDSQSYVPWGPVSMWGPTETTIKELDSGFSPNSDDVNFLLGMANRNLQNSVQAEDVISLRCGVRPLAVKKSFNKKVYPLDLSRQHQIFRDRNKNFLALYGGKLTSCGILASEVSEMLKKELPKGENVKSVIEEESFVEYPGLREKVPSPQWCRDFEDCCTLEDYLRRRSNISQWVANGGFGKDWQNESSLVEIAKVFHGEEAQKCVDVLKKNLQESILRKM